MRMACPRLLESANACPCLGSRLDLSAFAPLLPGPRPVLCTMDLMDHSPSARAKAFAEAAASQRIAHGVALLPLTGCFQLAMLRPGASCRMPLTLVLDVAVLFKYCPPSLLFLESLSCRDKLTILGSTSILPLQSTWLLSSRSPSLSSLGIEPSLRQSLRQSPILAPLTNHHSAVPPTHLSGASQPHSQHFSSKKRTINPPRIKI